MAERKGASSGDAGAEVKWIAGSVAALGALAILVAFLTAPTDTAFWSNVITGALIVAASSYNAWAAARTGGERALPLAVVTLLLGLWLAVSPAFLVDTRPYAWSNISLGVLIVTLAAFNAWASAAERRPAGRGA